MTDEEILARAKEIVARKQEEANQTWNEKEREKFRRFAHEVSHLLNQEPVVIEGEVRESENEHSYMLYVQEFVDYLDTLPRAKDLRESGCVLRISVEVIGPLEDK